MKTYTFMVVGRDAYNDNEFFRVTVDIEFPGSDMIRVFGNEKVDRMIQEKLNQEYPGYKCEEWRLREVK